MSESLSQKELKSLVSEAVAEAMKVGELECPECHAKFTEPARYMDHRMAEYVTQKFTEAKAPDPQKFVLDCSGDICKLVEKHVEATYDMKKKKEAAPAGEQAAPAKEPEGPEEEKAVGLWDGMEDEPEEG